MGPVLAQLCASQRSQSTCLQVHLLQFPGHTGAHKSDDDDDDDHNHNNDDDDDDDADADDGDDGGE